MSRRVEPYSTRIALNFSELYGSVSLTGPFFVPLREPDIELFRLLIGYARREIQWMQDTTGMPAYYVTPTDTQWQSITDNLDELEWRLMNVLEIDALLTEMQNIHGSISALSCICTQLNMLNQRLPEVSGYIGEGIITPTFPEDSFPELEDYSEEKCQVAQVLTNKMYEFVTEDILPKANSTADALTVAIIATATFAGLATWIGIPLAVLADIFAAVVAWSIDGAIANIINGLLAHKQDLICAYYNNLDDLPTAIAAAVAVIDAEEEFSPLDKGTIKALYANEWYTRYLIADYQENPDDYSEYIAPGACVSCGIGTFDYLFTGTPCEDADFIFDYCYEDFVLLDVAKTATTDPTFAVPSGSYMVNATIYASGTGDYGGLCHATLYKGAVAQATKDFTVTTSAERQTFALSGWGITGPGDCKIILTNDGSSSAMIWAVGVNVTLFEV
jgi:hypothetical protein